MIEVLTKVLEVAFKPLLDLSKDVFLKVREPKRKMVKDLLSLYEALENVEYQSTMLVQKVEGYIADNRIAWTVLRKKKQNLASCSGDLMKATNELGKSLQRLYWVLEINNTDLLDHLVGIYSAKGHLFGRIFAAPRIEFHSGTSEEGSATILAPTESIMTINYDRETLQDFYHNPEKITKNYLVEIDLDNKEQIIEMLERTRPILSEIGKIREMLKEFIKKNFSIEDYFR